MEEVSPLSLKVLCDYPVCFFLFVHPGPRPNIHSIPVAVSPPSNPEEWRPGLVHEHAHRRKNV